MTVDATKQQIVLEEIQAAKNGVMEAEGDLAALMNALQAATRAEKTTISDGLRQAFEKLRAAREHLVKLEELARGRVE